MNEKFCKLIYKKIKKYNTIVIARHIGADPDALGAQFALRDTIKNKFPYKNVYAIGNPSGRFKFMGSLDKIDDAPNDALLIVVDTPDIKRIDGINLSNYNDVIKIDHHPFIEHYGNIEWIDESSSSASQMILELIFNTKLIINKVTAELLYMGIVSDTSRFLHEYTSIKTFNLVAKLIKETNINFTSLYSQLYMKPFNEIKFQGYVFQNIELTENGFAYIKITDDLLKKFGVDSASAGNMINDLGFVNEILVWAFFTEDVKSDLVRVNMRSRGPIINEVASKYGGGGHKYASGARLTNWKQADALIEEIDELVYEYKAE